jgi:hypothetical protein
MGLSDRIGAKVSCGALAALLTLSGLGLAQQQDGAFRLVPDQYGMVLKTPDGRIVFRYMTKKPIPSELTANSVCCLFPLNTPSGEGTVDFAPSDHRHHRGVFMTWYTMGGKKPADFWGGGVHALSENRVIQNRSVKLLAADDKHARLAVRNVWTVEGEVMIEEDLALEAREVKHAYVVDLDFRLTPTSPVTLNQAAFGGLCLKARKGGKAAYFDPKGEVRLPMPHPVKPESTWPAADWYDYTIRLDSGKTIGVAILDHPSNPPTRWHNMAPISMLNPCIVTQGPVTIKREHPLRLSYRLVVHDGPAPVDFLASLTQEWRSTPREP